MKNSILLALLLLISSLSFAAGKTPAQVKDSKKSGAQLGTSFKFDGARLRGKYQGAMSTNAKVENDKLLADLLKGRTEFNDRLHDEADRN